MEISGMRELLVHGVTHGAYERSIWRRETKCRFQGELG